MQPILKPNLTKVPEKKGECTVQEKKDNAVRSKQCMEPPVCDDRLIWDIWTSLFHLPALTVADELGLFRTLYKKPGTVKEISENFSLNISSTEALLGVLTSLGFLVQYQGRFYITDVSRTYLLPESPYYWGWMLQVSRNLPNVHVLLRNILLEDGPFTYEAGEIKVSGKISNVWVNHALSPKQAEFFSRVMHSHSFPAAIGVAQWGDFTHVQHLLDVGGGSGCFCIALAMRYPKMHFTIMELPVISRLTEKYIAEYELQDRIDIVASDMFTDVWPTGCDAVFFSNIFHDWDRNQCAYLGERSFEVLPSGGYIYVHEILLSDTKDAPLAATSYSLGMTLFYGNSLLTAGELDGLLKECGFEDVSITPTYSYYSLVRGRKP